MKSMFRILCLAFLCTTVGQVQGGFLTFDETPALTASGGLFLGGNLANGFSITTLASNRGAATDLYNFGIIGSAYSGQNAMFNYNDREGYLERTSTFDLVGAFFKNDNRFLGGSATFVATGYNSSGTAAYSQTITLVGTAWQHVSLNMAGIRGFGFNPLNPDVQNMSMDDMEYNNSQVVPEPASFVIWGIGALGMGLVARRRAKKVATV